MPFPTEISCNTIGTQVILHAETLNLTTDSFKRIEDNTLNIETVIEKILAPINDKYFKKEQKLYIPAEASFDRVGTQSFDLYTYVKNFAKNTGPFEKKQKKVLLLLGEGGSGKSMFCQYYAIKLAKNYKFNMAIPLYIPLGSIRNPIDNLLKEFFEMLQLTSQEIIWLKKQEVFLFLDAYDEARQKAFSNFYRTNKLWEWKKIKVIATCRTSHLKNDSNYRVHFVPWSSGSALSKEFEEIYVSPFGPTKINQYIRQYINCKSKKLQFFEEKWRIAQTYENYIEQISGLSEVAKTPLFLKITMEVLPEIASKYEAREFKEFIVYTKRNLLEKYMKRWYDREEEKLVGEDLHPGDDMSLRYERFCQELAHRMGLELDGKGIYAVTWPLLPSPQDSEEKKAEISRENQKWEYFFGGEKNSIQDLTCRGVPLRKPGFRQFSFLHNEIQAYYSASNDLTATKAMQGIIREHYSYLTTNEIDTTPVYSNIVEVQSPVDSYIAKKDNTMPSENYPPSLKINNDILANPSPILGRSAQVGLEFWSKPERQDELLFARLPDDEQTIYFRQNKIPGNGNCGLTGLGTNRKEWVRILLKLVDNLEARESVWQEIYQAFSTHEISPFSDQWEEVFQEKSQMQLTWDNLLRSLKEKIPAANQFKVTQTNELICWLEEQGQKVEANKLRNQDLAVFQVDEAVRRYCCSKEVYCYFVKSFLSDKCRLWIGHASILLFAKAKPITVYLWEKEGSNQLKLTNNYIANENKGGFHLLYTNNSTHFDLLEIVECPVNRLLEQNMIDGTMTIKKENLI